MVQKMTYLQSLLTLVLYCWLCLPVYAATQIQILTTRGEESSDLFAYLSKDLGSDVQVSMGEQINHKADLLVVLQKDLVSNLPAQRPPILFVLPQPLAIELQKQDSALYWTPSLAAQLALIKTILPATNRVGMLVGAENDDMSWLRTFKQYAQQQSVEVRIQSVDKSRIGRQVSELATATDVLLAQPDSSIYNRETIRFILLAAYRQNKALIGPSLAFVNAGALATLYAAPASINQEISQRIQYFIKQQKLPPSGRVKRLEVSVNPQVAKSLGLNVPSSSELQRIIRFEELPIWP